MVEFCPNCGNDVEELDSFTGWCSECTPTEATPRRIAWLEKNADKIEDRMMQGLTVAQAISVVREDNRPTCLCCGDPIYHGTAGRHFFCKKRPECRKARRRYKYLVYDKGMSKSAALNVVLDKAA